MRRFLFLAVIALGSATVFGTSRTALGQQLTYRLSSSATATYRVVDTTRATRVTPDGPSGISGTSTVAYALSFESAGDAVRASANVTSFEGQWHFPSGNPSLVSQDEAGIGSFVVLLGERGVDEFVSGKSRAPSQFLLLVDPYEAVFPRLPGGEIELGDSWVDTVTTAFGSEGKRIVAYTYTLVSDTIVDDRVQFRIAVSGDARLTSTGTGIPTNLAGAETGSFLWDNERGLVTWWRVSRSYEGRVQDRMGQVAPMTYGGTTLVRLKETPKS